MLSNEFGPKYPKYGGRVNICGKCEAISEKIKVIARIKSEELREYVETIIKEDGRYEIVLFNINDKYDNDIEIIPLGEYIDKLITKICFTRC